MNVKPHYDTIRNLLKNAGFTVLSVTHSVDESCSPEVGFHVTLQGKQKKGDNGRFYSVLRNYAFSISFTKTRWKSRKGKKKSN